MIKDVKRTGRQLSPLPSPAALRVDRINVGSTVSAAPAPETPTPAERDPSIAMSAQTIKAPVDVQTSPKASNPLNPTGIKP